MKTILSLRGFHIPLCAEGEFLLKQVKSNKNLIIYYI